MNQERPIIAILYDFDKTLSPDDMQNFRFVPNLGVEIRDFWQEAWELTIHNGMDKILAYMLTMVKKCREKGIPMTREYLASMGSTVEFFPGVQEWFSRINRYARELGVEVEHYIVSSGVKEIIENTPIAKEFREIYGCEFLYDENGLAYWPKNAINYTAKTQYVFRVAKGVLDSTDEVGVNTRKENLRIPFRNMIYIGDGITDIPCMTLIKEKGGKSIAIHPQCQKEKVAHLQAEKRVNYTCCGDYREGSELDQLVKQIIEKNAIVEALLQKES